MVGENSLARTGDNAQISILFGSVHIGSIRLKSEDERNRDVRQLANHCNRPVF
jgi:hypothetical protein